MFNLLIIKIRRLLFSLVFRFIKKFGYIIIKERKGFRYIPSYYGKSKGKMRDIRKDALFADAANFVISSKRTMLHYDRLYYLYQALRNVINRSEHNSPIYIVEAGVYRGGASYFLAYLGDKLAPGRVRIFSVDTFTGHDKQDIPKGLEGGQVPGGLSDTSYNDVKEYLLPFSFVQIIQGRIQERAYELPVVLFDMVHLDVDLFEPTKFGLSFFGSRMTNKGIIMVDDYGFVTAPGVKKAVDGYFNQISRTRATKIELDSGQCLLVF